jgi:hypothetical protein
MIGAHGIVVFFLDEPEEIRMRSLVGGIAAAAVVALMLGGFISAIQAVEFHGLQYVVPGDGEIRFGNTQTLNSSTSQYAQSQTTPHFVVRVDIIQKASESAHG